MKRHHLFALLLLTTLAQNPLRADQEALGRLFFTPQQRAELDRQRLQGPGAISGSADTQTAQTINGEIRRSGGRSTRWINGQVQWNEPAPASRVPVGDTFHPSTGEHESLLGAGKIVIRPAAKGP